MADVESQALEPITEPSLSEKRRAAVGARWAAVREERDRWITPFHDLKLDAALAYLEDLRNICEEGGNIINERINDSTRKAKCSGPRCGKDLSGVRANGTPKYVSRIDLPDKRNPIGKGGRPHTVPHVFCSEDCYNRFMRQLNTVAGENEHGKDSGAATAQPDHKPTPPVRVAAKS